MTHSYQEKAKRYAELVSKRKRCRLCIGLENPAVVRGGRFDSDEIGPWSLWQNRLCGDVLVAGQDWGDVVYFEKWRGADLPKGNPTNENLRRLMANLDIEIGRPGDEQGHDIFLTNLILCLKTGGLQAPIKSDWLRNCTREFFGPLLEIIRPRIVVALGLKTVQAILAHYQVPFRRTSTLSELMTHSPCEISAGTCLFPVDHCGASGMNRNRSFDKQAADWKRIGAWLRSNPPAG